MTEKQASIIIFVIKIQKGDIMQFSSRLPIAVHILLAIVEFEGKVKTTSAFLAGSVNVNPVIIRNTIGQLKAAGLVTVRAGEGGTFSGKRSGGHHFSGHLRRCRKGRGFIPFSRESESGMSGGPECSRRTGRQTFRHTERHAGSDEFCHSAGSDRRYGTQIIAYSIRPRPSPRISVINPG